MVFVLLDLRVSPGKRTAAIDTLSWITSPTEAKPRCIRCGLYSNTEHDDRLIFLQEWKDRASLEKFIRTDEFRHILAAMELAAEQPEISFMNVTGQSGLELVEKLRLQP